MEVPSCSLFFDYRTYSVVAYFLQLAHVFVKGGPIGPNPEILDAALSAFICEKYIRFHEGKLCDVKPCI